MTQSVSSDNDTLQAHQSWIHEASRRLKMNYGDARQFSMANGINHSSVISFLDGEPVAAADFKAICNVLDFGWKTIQMEYLGG